MKSERAAANRSHSFGFRGGSGAVVQLIECRERIRAIKDGSALNFVTIDQIAWSIDSAEEHAAP